MSETPKTESAASPEQSGTERRTAGEGTTFYVLVKHTGRDARTRTVRAARSGHRRQGVTLDDGTRIRKKGRDRFTQVDLRDLVSGHSRLLEYIRVGQLEAYDPTTQYPMSYEQVVRLVDSVGHHLVRFDNEQARLNYRDAMVAYEAAMKVHTNHLRRWEERKVVAEKENARRKKAGMLLRPLPVRPEEPTPPEEPKEKTAFVLNEFGASLGDGQHGVTKAMMVEKNPHSSSTSDEETGLLDDEGQEVSETEEESEVTEESETEEESKWDEEGLLAQGRTKLNEIASEEFGVENPEKLPNKQAVVDAIMAISNKQE